MDRCIFENMRLIAFFACVATIALSLHTKPALAGDDLLDLDEVRALLVGNTIHGIGEESGWFFAIYYRPNGIASGRSSRVKDVEPVWYEEGRWEITNDNGYCLQWKTWKRGQKRCMHMLRQNGSYEFRTYDGRRQSVVEVLKGNPDNL